MRINLISGLFMAILLVCTTSKANAEQLPMPDTGEDGMHIQDWVHDSFLDLGEDLAEAAADGKRMVIMWEQRGCPYCKRMHEVNLRIPRVVDYIKRNFIVHQFNMWGDRKVTDFDGEELSEKELANKYGILYTPTLQFFPQSLEKVAGRSGKDAEVVRIPGYFKPFHFFFLFHYAFENGYEEQPNFQRWLGAVGDELDEKGIKYDLWSDDLPEGLPEKFL
ncbi:MAG: thioredoxin fold domain-containing protein [Rhodospirillaceae bacterium]|jgi:thioredoxin-related protein|nr:thioredoxin fold domain-containing protein [Rhodospirillaceae bacterium]MBT5014347.1 thioredoxin fold domain-containing protein [Rhodospirillaceae bacterium]MBT7355267.1 thioredoxin fold domain-containing protein [Rhodospirillaceae bacterium]